MHLADSLSWAQITGEPAPTRPPTATDYARAGLPFFEHWHAEREALDAMPALAGVSGPAQAHRCRSGSPTQADCPVTVQQVVRLGGPRPVREMEVADRPRAWGAR